MHSACYFAAINFVSSISITNLKCIILTVTYLRKLPSTLCTCCLVELPHTVVWIKLSGSTVSGTTDSNKVQLNYQFS